MPRARPSSPYKGLAAFEDSDLDALLFFGRVREIEIVAANLEASRLTVLYGPSGVGKSSLLRAGVSRRLRSDGNAIVEIVDRWSGAAMDTVRAAIVERPADCDLYLILDQFEEYFLYRTDDELPALLAALVADARARVNVLVGIREDALSQLDAFRRALPGMLSNRLRLDRLDRDAAREASVHPLARYADLTGEEADIEPALVEEILDAVAAGRVDLAGSSRGLAPADHGGRVEAPYLQLVLQTVWEAERAAGSNVLRASTLRGLGGASHVVEGHLEQAMGELTPEEKQAAAAMYDHLVTPSGTKIAQRAGDLAGYASVPEAQASRVLDKLARERIVRATSENGAGSARYEIFHDVLADAVLAWRSRYVEEEALHMAERRRRRAFAVAAAALAGLILFAAIAVFALVERGNSRSQARRARAEALAAEALTQLGVDPSSSLRLAVEAARLRPQEPEEEVLRASLSADRLRRILRTQGAVSAVAYDSGGKRELVGSADGTVRIYRNGSSRAAREFRLGSAVTTAALAPNGRLVAGGGGNGSLRIWDTRTGSLVAGATLPAAVRTVEFVERGRRVVAAADGGIWLFRAVDGKRLAFVPLHGNKPLIKVAVAPDGRQAVAEFRYRVARVYALPSGRPLYRLAHEGFVEDVDYSHDGRLIATAGYGGAAGVVRLWDARTGRLVRELRGALRHVLDVAFSDDGKLVGGASADGTARVWETATGTQIAIMIGHGNQVTSVDFNPSGTALVSASSDGTARVWGASGGKAGRLLAVLAGHRAPVGEAVFAPDGRSVLTGSEDGTARIWDPGSAPPLTLLARSAQPLVGLAVRDRGQRIVVRHDDGTIEVRALDGQLLGTTGRPPRPALSAVDSSGRTRAVGLGDVVRLLDARSGRLLHVLRGHSAAVNSVDFSPDGRLLVTSSDDHDALIWDVRTGQIVQQLRGHFGPVMDAAFSPDGRWVVTAGPISAGLWLVGSTAGPILLDAPVRHPLSAAAFAGGNGRLVVATSLDGTLRSYPCDICGNVDELLALAKRRLTVER